MGAGDGRPRPGPSPQGGLHLHPGHRQLQGGPEGGLVRLCEALLQGDSGGPLYLHNSSSSGGAGEWVVLATTSRGTGTLGAAQ